MKCPLDAVSPELHEVADQPSRVRCTNWVWGDNGTFPGPTIKARLGRSVVVRHISRLGTPTCRASARRGNTVGLKGAYGRVLFASASAAAFSSAR